MNAANTVGLAGPAPPATGTSPAANAGPGEAEPFADVLQGAGPPGPAPARIADEPQGPEPGSLDVAELIQLLLGGDAPPGDRTIEPRGSQPDRVAEAGTDQTGDAGEPAVEEMLVALMAQLAVPPAEPTTGQPLTALPVAAAAARTAVPGRVVSPPGDPGMAAMTADGLAVAGGSAEVQGEAPRVVLPSAAADAPRSEAAPVAVPDGEQQQALPLGSRSAAEDAATADPLLAELEPVDEPVTADVEADLADLDADDGAPDQRVAEPRRAEVQSTVAREPGITANVDAADAALPPTQPVTSSSRSPSPVSGSEPAAAPASNDVFTGELASTVRRASLLGDQEVRLLLNPPELGHLDIRVVESPAGLRVVLETASAEARELIEQQLPALRTALEGRDLKVERLQVGQALDASATGVEAERGLQQDGQGDGGSDQSDQGTTPWSPIASMRSEDGADPALVGASSRAESTTRTTAGDRRLDVLA